VWIVRAIIEKRERVVKNARRIGRKKTTESRRSPRFTEEDFREDFCLEKHKKELWGRYLVRSS
jgi:hypothetical protein